LVLELASRALGISAARAQVQKQIGRRIYRYRIEPESMKRIEGIVERRKVVSHKEFGSKQYGWSETEDDEDVS
jgi:hypothetical protein